jgi:hypothetical protein
MAFAHDASILKHQDLGFVSYFFVLLIPSSAMSIRKRVLWSFEVQTTEKYPFCLSADV